MNVDVREFYFSDLAPHPWQQNIPDIPEAEFRVFKRDVKERGLQEPITVSMREGTPTIVDGHQRLRAAKELGISKLTAIVKPFADEDEEIIYLAGAARYRRHLTDPQKVAIGKAYDARFKLAAKANQGKRNDLLADRPISEPVHTSAKAAELVGMSERQYRRGKVVADRATPKVKEAWEKGQLSTNAAYEQTRQAEKVAKELSQGSTSADTGRPHEAVEEPVEMESAHDDDLPFREHDGSDYVFPPGTPQEVLEAAAKPMPTSTAYHDFNDALIEARADEVDKIGGHSAALLKQKDLAELVSSALGVMHGLPNMWRLMQLGMQKTPSSKSTAITVEEAD